MPRLPTVEDLGARPAPSPDTTVAPISGGVEIARQIGGIGDALIQIDKELTERRRHADLTDALGKATEEIGTKAIEFQRDQDFRTAPTRFKETANEIGKKYAAGLTDPRVREVFGQQFGQLAVAKQLGVVQTAAKQEADFNVSALDGNLDTFATSAGNAQTAIERQIIGEQARLAIEENKSAGWITDVQARKMNDKYQQGYFMTLRNRDPVGAFSELMDSRGRMDPLLASRLQSELFNAAQSPMAVGLLDSIRFNPSGVSAPPPSYDEVLPGLKAAITKRESGGNPDAVSPQGARGSVQIMPDTFKQYAMPGESFDVETDRVNAAYRKIEDDYRFYKGDIRKVAAAYLGGRGAVTADGKIRNDVADALGTTPAAYAEQVSAMVGASRQHALNTAVASPEGLIQEYLKDPSKPTGNELVDSLPADQKMAVLRTAQTLASQDLAQYKQAVSGQYKDTIAAYEHGKTPPNPTTPEQLIQAHGVVEGTRMIAAQVEAKQYGELVKQSVGMPLSAQMSLFAQTEPQPGPGYAEAQRRHQQLGTAIAQIKQERDQDSSGFALRNSPQVKTAFDSMAAVMSGKTSEADKALASQQYAQATLAEQTRLEIGDPKILTKQMIDGIAKEFGKPQGVDTVSVIDGMANQWGSHYPQVMKELRKSLPPQAIVIGLGIKPEASQDLSELSKLKPAQRNEGLQDTDLKEINTQVSKKLEAFNRTVAFQEGGVETYANFSDSAQMLAANYVKRGMNKGDAASKAVENLLDFKYDFVGTWRVPKAVLGGATTTTNLQSGVRAATRELTDQPNTAFMVPAAEVKGLRPEDAAKQWARTVRDSAVWVTTSGDTGLSLYVKSGSSAQPVLNKAGKPISWTWQELTNQSAGMAAFGVYAPIRPGVSR